MHAFLIIDMQRDISDDVFDLCAHICADKDVALDRLGGGRRFLKLRGNDQAALNRMKSAIALMAFIGGEAPGDV